MTDPKRWTRGEENESRIDVWDGQKVVARVVCGFDVGREEAEANLARILAASPSVPAPPDKQAEIYALIVRMFKQPDEVLRSMMAQNLTGLLKLGMHAASAADRELHLAAARDAIKRDESNGFLPAPGAAAPSAPPVTEGMVMVPIEPTPEMIAAAVGATLPDPHPNDFELCRNAARPILAQPGCPPTATLEGIASAIATIVPAHRAMLAAVPRSPCAADDIKQALSDLYGLITKYAVIPDSDYHVVTNAASLIAAATRSQP